MMWLDPTLCMVAGCPRNITQDRSGDAKCNCSMRKINICPNRKGIQPIGLLIRKGVTDLVCGWSIVIQLLVIVISTICPPIQLHYNLLSLAVSQNSPVHGLLIIKGCYK